MKKFSTDLFELPGGEMKIVFYKIKKEHQGRIILCEEDVFNGINEFHSKHRQMGIMRAWVACSAKYYRITQKHCKAIVETCATCLERNPTIPPAKGVKKPILSHAFCDCLQVDLINMRKLAMRDV